MRIKQNLDENKAEPRSPLTEMQVLYSVIQFRKLRFREAKVPKVLAGRQG